MNEAEIKLVNRFNNEINTNEFKLVSYKGYKTLKSSITIKHIVCGNIDTKQANTFFQNPTCRFCKNEQKKYQHNKRLTHDDYIKLVKKLHGNKFIILSQFTATRDKVKIKCNECGYEWEMIANGIRKLKNCPNCANNLRKIKFSKSNEDFLKELNELGRGEYELISEYINNKNSIKVLHKPCNTIIETSPSNLLGALKKNGRYCKVCFEKKRTKTTEQFAEEVFNGTNGEYTLMSEYINNKTKVKIRHNECGLVFEIRPDIWIRGSRCPKCNRTVSKDETQICKFLKEHNIDFTIQEKIYKEPTKLCDIYVSDKKVGIEFDGLYWHSDKKNLNAGKSYYDVVNMQLSKTIDAEERGIHLIHIFEDEWKNKKDIVKAKLLHILGEDHNPVIYARKCHIEEITAKDKDKFLEENHIQGKDRSKIKLGMWYQIDDETKRLVAVMTFRKPPKNEVLFKSEYCYELARFATDINYRVVGAFSKMWKYFINNYTIDTILTYADRRWSYSKNNVYEKCGFIFDHISDPSYWYVKSSGSSSVRESRKKYQKLKLPKIFPDIYTDEKTEKIIMEEAGYYRVYDCGNLVFLYKNEKFNNGGIKFIKKDSEEEKLIRESIIENDKKPRLRTARKTTEEFKEELKIKNPNIDEVLGQYVNSKTKIRVRYKCGHENDVTPSVLVRGFKCAKCTGALGFTTEDFKKQVYDLVGDEYTVLGEYVKNDIKITIQHNSDRCKNHIYNVTPDRFKAGDRCPECRRLTVGKKISKSLNRHYNK